MATYTITVTDTEEKALKYISVDPEEFLTNFAKSRARGGVDNIINALVAHCNANGIAIATGEDAQVTQALDLGVVLYLADVPVERPE